MKVYNAVIFQTDMRGHNKELHEFSKRVVRDYIDKSLRGNTEELTGVGLLVYFVKCWKKFTLLAKMLDRMFESLNRYYFKIKYEE